MPTLPWTVPTRPDAVPPLVGEAGDTPVPEALVLASKLELRSWRDVVGFLRVSMAIRRQVLGSAGALGVSLVAQPLARTFWTLSAWTDEPSMRQFVRTAPHAGAMRRYRDRMRGSRFVTWTVPTGELPSGRGAGALWAEGRRRLGEQAVPRRRR